MIRSPSGGASYTKRPREAWHALLQDAHPGYISWQEFEANQEQLLRNLNRYRPGPVREGIALLQGIVLCGKCGKNMTTFSKRRAGGRIAPHYMCNRAALDYGAPKCTFIPGTEVDRMISSVLLDQITPMAMEAAITVQHEIVKRAKETDKLLRRQVERAEYEADLARRHLMAVEPENRLVARTFEDEWNEKLEQLEQAKAEYAQRRAQSQSLLDAQKQAEIRRIATDFPSLWAHPATSMQDKKRMVRLLIEDVTLTRHHYQLDLFIRFKAGALIQRTVRLARGGPLPTVIDPAIIDHIDTLSNAYTAGEIAAKLNQAGVPHPNRGDFDTMAVVYLLKRFKLPSRYQRLRSKGYVTQEEIAQALGVHVETVQRWRKKGWIQAHYYNDQKEYLYEPSCEGLPPCYHGKTIHPMDQSR